MKAQVGQMPTATSSMSTAERCELAIADMISQHGMTRSHAIYTLTGVRARLIADDAVNGEEIYPQWAEEYAWLRDYAPKTIVPGLAEHTAAACDTITRAARTCTCQTFAERQSCLHV